MEMKKSFIKLQCIAALALSVGAPIASSVSLVHAETTTQSQKDATSFSAKLSSKSEQAGRLLIRNTASKDLSITKVELLDKDGKSLKTIYDSSKDSKDVSKSGEDLLVNFEAPKADGMSVKVTYDNSKLGEKEAISTVAVLLKDGSATSAAKQFNAKNESKDQVNKSIDEALSKLQELKKAEELKKVEETKHSSSNKPSASTKPSADIKPSTSVKKEETKPSAETKPLAKTETSVTTSETKTSDATKPSNSTEPTTHANDKKTESRSDNLFANVVKEKAKPETLRIDLAKSVADRFVRSYETAVKATKSETLPKTEKDLSDRSILDLKKEIANDKATPASIGQTYNTAYVSVKALSDKIDSTSKDAETSASVKNEETKTSNTSANTTSAQTTKQSTTQPTTQPSTNQSSNAQVKGKTPAKYANTNEKSSIGKIALGSVMLVAAMVAGFFGYKKFKNSDENESSEN